MRKRASAHAAAALQALTVSDMLRADTLAGSTVLAGAAGLDRSVERLNVMEVPDILPWVKPREFLLTTAYPLRDTPEHLDELVADLDDRGLAGLGIKVGRYLDAVPADMLEAAERRAFPIVRLPEGAAFDDILHEVLSEVLNRQAALLSRSEDSHQALLKIIISGGGWPEIARDLAHLLDAAVFLIDRDGSVRATGGPTEGPPLDAARTAGLLEPVRAHVDPSASGVIDHAAGRLLTVTISASDREHGRIVAAEGNRPLHPSDLHILENAATVAALVVTTEEAVAAVESKYATDFLHDLLDGRAGSTEEAVTRGAMLGWDIARPLIVLVAAPATNDEGPARIRRLDRITTSVKTALGRLDPDAAVVQRSEQVVVLTGAPDDREAATALGRLLVNEASDRLGQAMAVGISRPVEGPDGIGHGHAHAEQALAAGRRLSGAGAVAHFDDLGVLRLLGLIEDTRELREYAEETLGRLSDEDAESTELRRTLAVLLEENLNVAASARRLHFHYNTLRYRVDKLERLLGEFTRDPRLRLDIEVALRILDLQEVRRDSFQTGHPDSRGRHPQG